MNIPACQTLRLVLGDQLSLAHPWFESPDEEVLYVVAELHQEATYVRHHVQKISAFFLAMQAFAAQLEKRGHQVRYLDLDDTGPFDDLPALIEHLVEGSGCKRFEYQRPDEYRLLSQLESVCDALDIESCVVRTRHFYVPFDQLDRHFEAGKAHRMEAFYRRMRKAEGLLVDSDGEPEGGDWNYDSKNREKLPDEQDLPDKPEFENDASEVVERLESHGINTIGRIPDKTVDWPVSREQSLELLDWFVSEALAQFGPYQDALSTRDWALFHSRLSFSLNTKMLSPREVIDAVVDAWRDDSDIPLSSVEGFVRQVIGWREYMRGMYWANMPGYADRNTLGHDAPLPDFYWSGDTKMACMKQAITASLDHAYAHHIQRLMVTGNFALLAGVNPDEVDEWYLGIYADAIEWVQLPNTRGMSQFADDGLIASKPYCSSGQYIRRMGDACDGCWYKVDQRSGERSCPFNSLYWHFLDRHREHFDNNPRMVMPYRNWDRMDDDKKAQILETAQARLEKIEGL